MPVLKMDKVGNKVDGSLTIAQEAKEQAHAATKAAVEAKSKTNALLKQMGTMTNDLDALKEEGFAKLVKEAGQGADNVSQQKIKDFETALAELHPKDTQQSPQQDRDALVIFGGLDEEAKEDEVIKKVKAVLSSLGLKDEVDDVFTFEGPSKICIVRFETPRAEMGIHGKIQDVGQTWSSGDSMWWENSDSIVKRTVDKTWGEYVPSGREGHGNQRCCHQVETLDRAIQGCAHCEN